MATEEPCQLLVEQDIPPSPNVGANNADWLPEYGGLSWLAYGAGNSIVITVAPVPFSKEQAALGKLFQQVIHIQRHGNSFQEGEAWVRNVVWAPVGPCLGLLAASAGRSSYVFAPQKLDSSKLCRDLSKSRMAWEQRNVVLHDFPVLGCAWTQSGDGLLVVGSEVVMWKLVTENWQPLWKAHVLSPQALVAATWSIEGLAATAVGDGDVLQEKGISKPRLSTSSLENETICFENAKSIVKIWWWEESIGLQDVELSHPKPVLTLQWRPSSGRSWGVDSEYSGKYHRSVLLTFCKDGVARLWLEIDSGKARAEKAHGKERLGNRLKPAFFVSAIIDTVKDVQGNFNHDITVVWALETRIGNLMRTEEGKSDCIVPAAQISQVAPCEWVVGLRPCGSLTLWSLHCLDDIYPPRCPRVMMWQQKSGLLPSVCTSFADEIKLPSTLLSFKAIVNRPENGLAGPPTSVDLFEKFMAGHYRWSRVWPPVSAIGGDGSSDGATLVSSSTAKKNTWGISSELLHVYGHLGSVVSVAIHPVALARLAASLDDQGVVLIWSLSPFFGPPFDTGNFLVPVGRLSDRSTERLFGSEILDMLAWVPPLLLGSRAILIVGSSSTVDCYSISKTGSSIKEKFGSFSVVHSHLLRLTLPFPDNTNILKGVYSVSQSFSQASGSAKISFSVIGIGHQSSVISWNLEAQVEFREQASHLNSAGIFTCLQMQSRGTPSLEDLDIHQTGSFRIKKGICSGSLRDSKSCSRYVDDFANEKESIHVNLLDVTILNDTFDTLCLEFPEAPMEFDTRKSVLGALALEVSAYDFVTCGADGFLKFWKIHFDSLPLSNSRGKSYWECVGAVQIDTQPLKMLIVALKGRMIAFVESCLGGFQRIKIFEVIYSMMKIELLLSGEILVTTPVMAIRWFDMRNSQLLLGVSCQNHVYVYAENKVSSDKFGDLFKNSIENNGKNSWVCLASVSLSFMVNKLLWAPNGSIIVASESHICALSQWMCALPGESDAFGDKVTLTAPSKNDPHYSLSIKQRLHYLLKRKRACTLLEAAAALSCPLPEYHPRSIMHFLQTGKQEQARSCLRHLGKHLISAAHSFSKTKVIGIDSVPPYFSSLTIPHMHLEDLFNIECKISTMDCSLDGRELSLNTSSRLDNQEASSSTYSKKYDFLDTKAWLDHPFTGKHQEEQSSDNKYYDGILKSGGTESLTLAEANLLVSFVQHCAEIPGILEDEKSHILAMIDVLAEIDGSERARQFASLDQAGQRFWLATRYIARLDARKVIGTNPIETIVDSKAMAWAFQSENKENLLNMCLSTKLSWPSLRALGVGFWLTDVKVLRIIMEKLARVQYLERKDPKDCATLYLALGRQSVLSGLFKLSKDERDKPLVEFLSRNFQDERNKSAALKNAYTLMGKHRHELGVGIFLLGGDLSSACSVCVKNLNDPQLALVICRLVEGSVGPIGHDLISKHLIPSAREEGDNWLASLFRSLLQDPIGSLCELTSSKELTATYGPSESNMDLKHLIKNMSRTSRCFLLDSDVGDYCKLMASKPGMRAVLTDSGILEITSKACFTASMALKRIGLPLQALEQFHLCLKSSSKIGVDIPTYDTHYFESKNSNQTIPSFSVKGPTSWISPEVGAEIGKSLRETLALQYLAQLLLDHAGHLNSLSKDVLTNEAHMGSLAEADLQLSRDLTFLARSFSLNKEHIIFSLAILAQHYGSYHLSCRLGCRNSQSQDNFCLANELEVSGHAKTLLNLFHREAPWMVCRKILAYTQSACSGHNGNANSQVFDLLTADKNISTVSGQDFILEAQLIELVHFAKELLLLANALSRNECKHLSADERKTSGDESKRNKWSVFYLFPYVCLIAAAWLGRRPQTLLVLLKSACENPQTVANPALFSFSGKWLDLDLFFAHLSEGLEENLEAASIDTLKMKSSFQQTKKGLSNDFLWLVMGYSLWNHLLSSVKHFLHGTTSEVSYAGYGRTPLRQSSDEIARTHPVTPSPLSLSGSLPSAKESHVSDYGDLEEILLNMLACVAIGLRKQMVSSFRERAKTDVSLPCKLTDIIFTVDELREWREVYELLVNWEEIESSLRFEGVDLRKSTTLVQSDVGCSDSNSEPIQVQGVGKNYHRDVNNVVTGDGSAFACSSSSNTQTVISNVQYGSNSKSDGARGLIESIEPKKNQSTAVRFQKPEEILHLSGELFEALCINTCSPSQVVVASNRKGLIYYDIKTRRTFSDCTDNIWSETDWPRNGWAGSISTPVPTFVSPGVGLGSKEGSCIGLGGATVGIGALPRAGKDIGKGAVGFGIPGYAGMAAWGLGWEEWEDFEGFVDPPATIANVGTKAMDSHPLRPLFLVGSNNTHIYLWEFGKSSATATYGVLPAANVPPPYALASVSAVRFDRSGHRFATAAQDGTLCTWQLEVGGRSNVCPTESSPCFNRHASDVKFVGASGGIIAATGSSQSGENLIIWDTLAPPASSRVSVLCHEGGARCLDLFDHEGSSSPLIVTGGKAGDVSVHDFRYIATGKSKRQKSSKSENSANLKENSAGGLVWFLQKAHSASITTVSSIPGTPFFLTGSKDGDVKLWDVKRCELVSHWSKVHERHMFLQHNSRGFGAVLQAAVTAIRVLPSGFITCGGDGSVQLFQHLNQGFTASGG